MSSDKRSRRRILVAAAAVFLVSAGVTWGVLSLQNPNGLEATEIPGLYVRTSVIDLGLLAQGETGAAVFEFFNLGEHSWRINRVRTDCICATSDLRGEVIAPGASIAVPGYIRNPGLSSPGKHETQFQTQLFVELNGEADGKQYVVPLTIIGEVESRSRFAAIPGIIDFGRLVPGCISCRTVHLQGPPHVLDSLPENIIVKVSKQTLVTIRYAAEERGFATKNVEFCLAAPLDAKSDVASEVLIIVEGPKPHRLLIPVRASFADLVEVSPKRLYFNAKAGELGRSVDLYLTSRFSESVAVKTVASQLPLKWQLHDGHSGLLIRVEHERLASSERISSGLLTIDLASPQTKLEIPVVVLSEDP